MPRHPHDSRRLPTTTHPPDGGEPVRVFDVLLVTASGAVVSDEDRKAHPPVETPHVQLAQGLSLGALDPSLAELVMNACEFRGHFFYTTFRSAGPLYTYLLEQPLSEALQSRWDQEGIIRLAVALSRYVRDNADAGDYAARVTEYPNGDVRVMPYDCLELRHVYRTREDRDWLDVGDANELAQLISAFQSAGELPTRVRQAFWKAEHIAWERYIDVMQPVLVSALEGLLSTSREQLTRQFATRVSSVAAELGAPGVTKKFCRRMYEARSQGVHGGDIDLFQPGAQRTEAVRQVALLQTVLRVTVRRAIEDPAFRSVFEEDERIRQRWPVEVRNRWWRRRRVLI
jgi:hypothetical protein